MSSASPLRAVPTNAPPHAQVAGRVAWQVDATDPAIRSENVRDRAAPVALFGDPVWSLYPLGGAAGRERLYLHFERTERSRSNLNVPPAEWVPSLRRIAYVLVNEEMPASWAGVQSRGGRRTRLSAGTVKASVAAIRDFMAWLAHRHVFALDAVTPGLLDVYYADVVANDQVKSKQHFALLSPLERLAHLAPLLPEEDRLCMPDWKAGQVLKGDAPAAGTATAILDPAIADPMLMGAIAMVRDMFADILDAYLHVQEVLTEEPRIDYRAAREILKDLAETGALPGFRKGAKTALDAMGLRYRYGILERCFPPLVREMGLGHLVVDRPVAVGGAAVRGQVAGKPWCDGLPLRWFLVGGGSGDLPLAMRHLRTACWIVLAFLSGARPEEVRHLPIDTLLVTPPRVVDGPMRYQLRGHVRKDKEDEAGRASEHGEAVEWVTLAAGADAARVAARIAEVTTPGSPYLFPTAGKTHGPIGSNALAANVSDWVGWYNGLVASQGWPSAYFIPSDRGATWDLRTFRRTASWHIYEQPNGRRALQQQLKHVSTVMSAAYAFPAAVGARRLMRADAKAAHDARMADLADAVKGGGLGVSGPAADRLVETLATSEPVQAAFMTDREAATLSDIGQQVFDNPMAYSLCVYDPAQAKCMTSADLGDDETGAPQQGACQSDCRCHAFTDAQIEVLREDVADYRRGAASDLTPAPLRDRLGLVADRKQALVDQHEATKIFIDIDTLMERLGAVGGVGEREQPPVGTEAGRGV